MESRDLETVPLFGDLSRREREHVARRADEVEVPAGYQLLEEGRFPHEFFLILEGTVEVTKDGAHLTDLGPGDFFGEIAIVEHERRTASVVTTTPVRAVVMHSRDFEAIQNELPEVAQKIHAAIRERMSRG